jgi:hypothetical protein
MSENVRSRPIVSISRAIETVPPNEANRTHSNPTENRIGRSKTRKCAVAGALIGDETNPLQRPRNSVGCFPLEMNGVFGISFPSPPIS